MLCDLKLKLNLVIAHLVFFLPDPVSDPRCFPTVLATQGQNGGQEEQLCNQGAPLPPEA